MPRLRAFLCAGLVAGLPLFASAQTGPGLRWYLLQLQESAAAPATPPANRVTIYALDAAGTSNLYAKDDAGTVHDLFAAGAAGAPADAFYWTGQANATLTNEINLGALGTGLIINTAGTPSIYGGAVCINQFPRALSASGAPTCAAVADTDLASNYSGIGACGANTWASTLNDNAAPTCTQPGIANLSSSTSASLRTVLSDEVGGGAAMFGLDPAMRDDLGCTGLQVVRRNAGDAAFECATPSAGSGNSVEVSVTLSTRAYAPTATTVTGQAWVATDSEIVCGVLATTADGYNLELAQAAAFGIAVSDRVAGTGFKLRLTNPHGATGTFRFHCLGV